MQLGTHLRELWRTRTIPAPGVMTMSALIQAVDNPDWIAEPTTGYVVLKTAIVTHVGTELSIAAPEVLDIAMLSTPSAQPLRGPPHKVAPDDCARSQMRSRS